MKKKLLTLALSCTLLLSLAACGSSRDSAETVVENGIKAFQSMDQEAVRSYWGDTDLSGDGDTSTTSSSSSSDAGYSQKLLERIANGLSYEITGSTEDEDAGTATVTVDFTAIDMGPVLSDFMSDMISTAIGYAFLPEDQQPSDEEMNQMFMDSLMESMDAHQDTSVTNTVDVSLTLVDDAWKITPSDEVIDAMMGGMLSYFENTGVAFGSLAEEESP